MPGSPRIKGSVFESSPLRLLASLAFLYVSSVGAIGQAKPQSRNDQAAAQPVAERFVSALKAVSQRWNLVFVAEGTPLADAGQTISRAPANEMLDGAVNRIAAEFDYAADRSGRIVVLTKKYTNRRDLPDVTPEECRLALVGAASLLRLFDPKFTPLRPDQRGNPCIVGIISLLTKDQITALSQDGLPVTALSAAEREEIRRIGLHFFIPFPPDHVLRVSEHVGNILKQDPIFKRQTIRNIDAIGFQVKSGTPRRDIFFPISNVNSVGVDSNGVVYSVISQSHTQTRGGASIPSVDPVDPTEPSTDAGTDMTLATSSTTVTLAQAVAALNASVHQEKPYAVDPVLGLKTITLVGQNRTAADQLLAAVALVYGLRVVRQDTAVVLTRPANPNVLDLSELGAAIAAIIPRPLLQTFQMRLAMYRSEHNGERPGYPSPVLLDAGIDLRKSLYRALRAVIEPKVAASKDRSILLSDLKGAEKNLFGIALTVTTFGDLLSLGSLPLPLFITDFDHTVLTGGFSRDDKGRNEFSLYLWHVDPVTGKRRQCAGFINALIP